MSLRQAARVPASLDSPTQTRLTFGQAVNKGIDHQFPYQSTFFATAALAFSVVWFVIEQFVCAYVRNHDNWVPQIQDHFSCALGTRVCIAGYDIG